VAAAPASAEVRELGVSADAPLADPSCPGTDCEAIGRVSGYPAQIGSLKNPFLVMEPGKIVAFTVRLGKPDPTQITFFENLFGGQPQVRISVLKPARTKRRHRLQTQSEIFNVATYLGSSPTFALKTPLVVTKRSVIAITVPTWIPAFAINQPADVAWRFSREDCEDPGEPAAQQTLKSLRTYGCFKRFARPVYSVTFIPDPKPTSEATTPAPATGSGTGGAAR
jgi:hypothetical protein